MGLAASQARLLTITARKADCEFQSMSLSHQKLALARDMEKVSNDYQEALNTTKLVYDYYGSGTSDMDLTYDLLMTPSIYNDYYPKFVTDSTNKIILNSQYAAAARAAGIPAEGMLGLPSSDVRNKFIEALADNNIITTSTAASIEAVDYSNTIGNGSTISTSTSTTDIDYDELLTLIQQNCVDTASAGCNIACTYSSAEMGKGQRLVTVEDKTTTQINKDGQETSAATIKLEELLKGNKQYIIAYESGEGSGDGHTPTESLAQLQTVLVGGESYSNTSILSWLNDQFSTVLGGTTANDTALQYAYNKIYDLLYPSDTLQMNAKKHDSQDLEQNGTCVANSKNNNGFQEGVATSSTNQLGMVYSTNKKSGWFHDKDNDNATVAVNLNNLAQAYLTAFVDYMTGFEEGYSFQRGSISDCTLYDSERDNDFTFTIATETVVDNDDEQLYANFYDSLFNRICLDGWMENDQIDDKDYLSEMFKNGMAYISSIGEDGYYTQSAYSNDRAVLEVTDDEAISKAEAKYNSEKTKIENKEDTIDMKMKNLDTEISSLTTEYDTTKSVITKSIEKSFKRYDA